MTARTYITSEGARKRTGTARRYIVVYAIDGAIIYRTDDRARADARARDKGYRSHYTIEVIDLGAAS